MINMDIEKIVHGIVSEIKNQDADKREFWKTIQSYKFAFVTFIEATENKSLSPWERVEMHNLFINTISEKILTDYPELHYIKEREDRRTKELINNMHDA